MKGVRLLRSPSVAEISQSSQEPCSQRVLLSQQLVLLADSFETVHCSDSEASPVQRFNLGQCCSRRRFVDSLSNSRQRGTEAPEYDSAKGQKWPGHHANGHRRDTPVKLLKCRLERCKYITIIDAPPSNTVKSVSWNYRIEVTSLQHHGETGNSSL